MPSSVARVCLLRWFGALIGHGVVIKPSFDVKYPWRLEVGDHCWLGERVWIDNLATVTLASNVCISQGAYLCTGNHDWSDPHFGLRVDSIVLEEGSWVGAKAILAPGSRLGICSVAAAGTLISGTVPNFEIYAGNPARFIKVRVFRNDSDSAYTNLSDSEQDELLLQGRSINSSS